MSNIDFGHIDHLEKQLAKTGKLSHESSLHLVTELIGLSFSRDGKVQSFNDKEGGVGFFITNKDGTQSEIDFNKAGDVFRARPAEDSSCWGV